jgi:hypothetical protein
MPFWLSVHSYLHQPSTIRHNLRTYPYVRGRMLQLWVTYTINRLDILYIRKTKPLPACRNRIDTSSSYLHVKSDSLTTKLPTYTGHWYLDLSRGSWSSNELAVMVILLLTYLDRSPAKCWVMRADNIAARVMLRYALTSMVRYYE